MKPLKLFMDTRPAEQLDNTYPYGKNGIQFDLNGSVINEPGFRAMQAVAPFKIIGIIGTDSKPVLFCTNDINSAIGFFNPVTELYEPVVNDDPAALVNWPATGELLGFTQQHYITGQAQRNHKGELVVSFTDKDLFPKYLNCDKPDITRADDLRLFPFYSPPTLDLVEALGGSLPPGTYYAQVNYERNDGTVSPRSEVSQGLTIAPGEISGSTDKAVQVNISNADTSYDFIRVTIISKVSGKVTANEMTDLIPISGTTIEFVYTGDNLSTVITLEECLTPPAIYDRIQTIGQLNDALYIGGLHKEADLDDLQPYAAIIGLEWISELIDATAPPEEHKLGKKKSFMHEEVYGFYVRYHKIRGGFTKAFHIPGLPGTPLDFNTSAEALVGGEVLAINKFKVEDTIPAFNAGSKTGKFGIYVNIGELYPDTPEFDATPLGGPNLRGQQVRHHKVPSLRWCKQNLYSAVPEYGKTKLDIIGVRASNITIPAKYIGIIDGYEILYAKRTPSNMTIYGQGCLIHGITETKEAAIPTGNCNIYTSGGNWTSGIIHEGKGDYDDGWELTSFRQDTFRIHPFDILLNKPSIKPNFISAQYKLRRDKLRTQGYLEDGSIDGGDHNAPLSFLVDYTVGNNPTNIAAGKQLRKIKNSFFLSMGVTIDKFNNVRHENAFGGQLLGANWPFSYGHIDFRIQGGSSTSASLVTDFEESYVVNLMALKGDVYSAFYSQKLVSAGDFKALTDGDPFWGGDTFVCDYTFHTYGRHDAMDIEGDGTKGIKVIRRFVCESTSNIHLRYEIAGNEYSKWYPREGLAFNNPAQCYITNFDRSKDPNQFGYTKDLNALNDFISSSIFNPFREEIVDFPYRIHRGGKLSRQNRPRSWRSFLALDYYEMQKDKGPIVNLEGMDDTLLIHMENALFRTRDKAKLDAGVLSITLGTGDIFQFEPQEAISSKLGYAGTQHDLACVQTPVGYVFFDGKLGEMYLVKGDIKNMNEGIDTFLRQYLKIKEKNPYIGNGATIGWDQKYKRILLTVKNDQPAPTLVVKDFQDTNEFFDNLTVGDVILYEGRYIQYQGLNNPVDSGFDCPADPLPPDTFGWVAGDILCEQDSPVDEVPHEEGSSFDALSSPAIMQWDDITQNMWVADHDQVLGNFYKINLTTGAKTYVPLVTSLYNIVRDDVNRRIWGSSPAGGAKVLDITTETVVTVPYGSNTALSRLGLWSIGDTMVARDQSTNTLTLIDKVTLAVISTLNIITDIPSGAIYLQQNFSLLDVNGTIWVIPTQRSTAGIAIYTPDFSTLVTTIALTGSVGVAGWGSSMFMESAFYDALNDKVYIHDVGFSTLYKLDATTRTILDTIDFFLPEDNDNCFLSFQIDPVTGTLYLEYSARRTSTGLIWDYRVYILDRISFRILKVFMDIQIMGELVREGSTAFMWTAVAGLRNWEGGAWNTDGSIIKYAHGV